MLKYFIKLHWGVNCSCKEDEKAEKIKNILRDVLFHVQKYKLIVELRSAQYGNKLGQIVIWDAKDGTKELKQKIMWGKSNNKKKYSLTRTVQNKVVLCNYQSKYSEQKPKRFSVQVVLEIRFQKI